MPAPVVKPPFTFQIHCNCPDNCETAQATVTLEVEDTFTASNVSMNVLYNSSRLINVLLNTTPEGRTIVSAIGTPLLMQMFLQAFLLMVVEFA